MPLELFSTYCCAVGAIDGGKGAVIDLSFLKAAKDQYIRSYGNTLDSKGAYVYSDITKIVAQPAKLSIKYDASKGLVDGKTKEAIKIEDGYEKLKAEAAFLSVFAVRTTIVVSAAFGSVTPNFVNNSAVVRDFVILKQIR